MKTAILALVSFLASNAAAVTRCKSPPAPQELKVQIDQEPTNGRVSGYQNNQRFEINTYVHVITTEAKRGTVKQSAIDAQMRALNDGYKNSRISFRLKKVDYTVNDDWASDPVEAMPSAAELQYKPRLRKGSYSDLNLYILSDLGDGDLLGYAYFPKKNPTAQDKLIDGVHIGSRTLPGGVAPYNQGKTAVHEAGHWLSLFHTFGGPCEETGTCTCDGPGDLVSDTPASIQATYGACNQRVDTCPTKQGLDALSNYMSYTDDACLTKFSTKQTTRLLYNYAQLRWRK
ncbi:Extracellular metalloprotease [Pseudocercospora fuligena]|uniref:Extracellular metalloprotease n=1 Tax=Pseudocercospora fuligena TaxID=685502 RepID=A0A8H6RS56_9PEZI|nr:Extracellular metalloprotease [Pseudocercospora fuligena]